MARRPLVLSGLAGGQNPSRCVLVLAHQSLGGGFARISARLREDYMHHLCRDEPTPLGKDWELLAYKQHRYDEMDGRKTHAVRWKLCIEDCLIPISS